jgi:putative methyltransferase (TIGR04325 family)
VKRSLRSLASGLTPPLAMRVARRLVPRLRRPPEIFCHGMYDSFEDACRAAGDDHEDATIVDAVFAKTQAYRTHLATRPLASTPAIERVTTALGLVAHPARELRVIDFGGAFGTHYWIARAVLPSTTRLRWYVVETPAMCARGAELETEELRFVADLDAARAALGSPDLVYSDGVLQVLPDPLEALGRLVACDAPYLCVRRIGTTDRRVFTVLRLPVAHHEPDVPLPLGATDAPRDLAMSYVTPPEIEAVLRRHYDVRLSFGGLEQTYPQEHFIVRMRGYFCERRETSA